MSVPNRGFISIHANHLEDLRDSLVQFMRVNPLGPLESEQILVQSNGISQWLKLSIAQSPDSQGATGLGIAADINFNLPSEFIWKMYRELLPKGTVPKETPFDKRRLVWRLFKQLPDLVKTDKVYAPLARFLTGSDPDVRAYQLAEQLADLFDQYQSYRADWLAAWERGENVLINAKGERIELESVHLWQPALWRFVSDTVGAEKANTSRAQVHTRFMQLAESADELDASLGKVPKRIFVFGISSLSYQMLEALSVLSKFSQVIFCVLNPSRYYWADIISDRELLKAQQKRGTIHKEFSESADLALLHANANPLLASFGRQGRDFVRLLDEFDETTVYSQQLGALDLEIEIFTEHGASDSSKILHRIQNDIFNLVPVSEIDSSDRAVTPSQDDSITFHIAHSPLREVEILHDQLLAAFNSDSALQPKDIMVMVPDITKYAPYIKAVFGKHTVDSKRFIPFALSDQGERHRKPVLVAIETLLSLPRLRFTASEILALLDVPALRNKFSISESQLPVIRHWVEGANVRWGLNSSQRQSLDIPLNDETNSWTAGLRSMLLGYSLGDNESWAGVESFGEVSGLEAQIAGSLAEFIRRLEVLWQALQGERSIEAWTPVLNQIVTEFFDDSEDEDRFLIERFKVQVEKLESDIQLGDASDAVIPLKIVADRVLSAFDETSLNHKFISGRVNFASLMPMRAIPFKRICLLGMNDGDYPRSRTPLDFDLMGSDYRPGDRSRRDDDRYLFLESLLSAREQLYISWVGRSIQDDSERPSSILVEQLRDYIDAHWLVANDEQASISDALTTTHPLQPFSRKYFDHTQDDVDATALAKQRKLFTYEADWREALDKTSSESDQLRLAPLMPESALSFADLSNFIKRPIEQFYKRRLQIYFDEVSDEDLDSELFELAGLDRWSVEKELIQSVVKHAASIEEFSELLEQRLDRFARQGALGMASTTLAIKSELSKKFTELFYKYSNSLTEWPKPVESFDLIRFVELGDSIIQIEGSINNLYANDAGELCRIVIAESKILHSNRSYNYANLMADWVVHLMGQTERPFTTLILGKEERAEMRFSEIPSELASQLLKKLVEYWQLGMSYPLPLIAEASIGWINGRFKGRNPSEEVALDRAEAAFESALERDKGYIRASYPDFAALLAADDFIEHTKALYGDFWSACHGLTVGGILGDEDE